MSNIIEEKQLLDLITSSGGLIQYYNFNEYINPPEVSEESPIKEYIYMDMWAFGDYCETEYVDTKIKPKKGAQYIYCVCIPTKYWGKINLLDFKIGDYQVSNVYTSTSEKGTYIDFPIQFVKEEETITVENILEFTNFLNQQREIIEKKYEGNMSKYFMEQVVEEIGKENLNSHYSYHNLGNKLEIEDIIDKESKQLDAVKTLRLMEIHNVSSMPKLEEDNSLFFTINSFPYNAQGLCLKDEKGIYRFQYPIHFHAFGGDHQNPQNDLEFSSVIATMLSVAKNLSIDNTNDLEEDLPF